jgi:hypothetical protein
MDEHFQVREMEFFQISAFLVVFPFFPSDNSVMIKVRLGAYVRRRLTLLFFGDNKLKSNRNKYRCRFFILHLFAIIINDRQWQKLLAVDDRNLSFFCLLLLLLISYFINIITAWRSSFVVSSFSLYSLQIESCGFHF